jgi:hypothetical protein
MEAAKIFFMIPIRGNGVRKNRSDAVLKFNLNPPKNDI